MKKVELDITPLDDAIADFEYAIEQIDTQNDILTTEPTSLSSAEQIQLQLTELSTLMDDLQALLQKDMTHVKLAQEETSPLEERDITKKRREYRHEISNK